MLLHPVICVQREMRMKLFLSITRIQGIISGNDYYDRSSLDQMLQQAKAGSH
jgi:hypothetical protein